MVWQASSALPDGCFFAKHGALCKLGVTTDRRTDRKANGHILVPFGVVGSVVPFWGSCWLVLSYLFVWDWLVGIAVGTPVCVARGASRRGALRTWRCVTTFCSMSSTCNVEVGVLVLLTNLCQQVTRKLKQLASDNNNIHLRRTTTDALPSRTADTTAGRAAALGRPSAASGTSP